MMKQGHLFACLFSVLPTLTPIHVYARSYYISPSGNDSNPGTQDRPWQTIAKVNDTAFGPGDRIRFQGGQRFAGTIQLDAQDSGSLSKALFVTSYGNGPALIYGANSSGLRAKACNHLCIWNLNFLGSGRKAGNTEDGICIVDAKGLEINKVEISGFQKSGLSADGVTRAGIAHVYAHENGFAGISIGYHRRSHKVYIAHCIAKNNPGDPSNLTNHSGNGIVVANVQEGLIEYCEAANNGWDMPRQGNGPVGIWIWRSDRVVIQSCISHDNKSPGADGGGFDIDGGTTNSILQYNLSYNNDGPGYFLCQFPSAGPLKNNTIRFNISYNDGVQNNRRTGIDIYAANESTSGCRIYHNTIYNENGAAVGFGGLPIPGVVFRNNIFVCTGDVIAGDAPRGRFENNVYWSADGKALSFDGHDSLNLWAEVTGQETLDGVLVGKYVNPKLVMPSETLPTAPQRLSDMKAFRLHTDSVCINAGVSITNKGGRDFWGSAVPESKKSCIGAFHYPRSDTLPMD